MIVDVKRVIINNKKGILLVGIYALAAQAIFSYICPSMWLFGLPCPACGMTRAALQLLRLNFVQAFNYNPAIFLVPFAVYAYIKRRVGLFATIVAIVFVIFFMRLHTSFGVEPLVINRDSLMFRLIEL